MNARAERFRPDMARGAPCGLAWSLSARAWNASRGSSDEGEAVIDVRQLAALIAVAETGSVTRAAEILHLVQPAVSRQIRLLEEELGVSLFDRSRHGMRVTEDGGILLDHARRALGELERARAEIRPASGELHGIVTIGLLPSFAEPVSEALVRRLGEEHPGVRLRVLVGYAGHVAEWLDSAEVDLGALYDVQPSAGIEMHALLDEGLWVVGPPGADLVPDRPTRLADVIGRLTIVPNSPHAMRNMIERAAARSGITLTVDVETNSMALQRRLAAAGIGLTVLPGVSIADGIADGSLTAAPLTDPELQRRLLLALPATRRLGPAVHAVATMLTEEMARAVRSGTWPSATWLAH